MSKVTISQIISVIEQNNGVIPSNALAIIIGKQHGNLVTKMKSNFDESLLLKIKSSEFYEKHQNAKGIRDIYLLPEKEAMAMAMSYSVELGMQVYEAYQQYKQAIEKVLQAETIEEATEAAIEVYTYRQQQIIKLIKQRKSIGAQVIKLFDEHDDMMLAWSELYDCYKTIPASATSYRRDVIKLLRNKLASHNAGLRVKYRARTKRYDHSQYQLFDRIESQVRKLESALRCRDITKGKKVIETERGNKEVLKSVIKHVGLNPDAREEIISVLTEMK
ncbi:hypothetical protein [Vibrio sp. ER1A]|uniref:hypothetical protein n=1 Tax=Vibrio sp. ER1A TaxID=1517681 RepID=UPI0004DD4C95|nr:hypothetical protein [Vibrio sp. ER1A]KFA99230.1 hypothetical protein HW45_05075 [Vibrio sp. ER1A]